ncbi:MAG: hypothetical protein MUF31_16335 [Akkermansiaceae bacterium]|jgi:hypothetical protein|nr:hypothetical protein [Akkermansiaceae bacterium]
MDFYPIQAILIYLSILFAPMDTQRVDIAGMDFSASIRYDGNAWLLEDPDGFHEIGIEGTRLIDRSTPENSIELKNYISQAQGHDWQREPGMALPDDSHAEAISVEKTPEGFRIENQREKLGRFEYRIIYSRADHPAGARCRVFGAVKKSGFIALHEDDTLRSVLEKSGGLTGHAFPLQVWVIAPNPGSGPHERQGFDPAAVLAGTQANPTIHDGSTVYVMPGTLLEIRYDGTIMLDGKAGNLASISAWLEKRHRNGVRHARILSSPHTSPDQIKTVTDLCRKVGITETLMKARDADK